MSIPALLRHGRDLHAAVYTRLAEVAQAGDAGAHQVLLRASVRALQASRAARLWADSPQREARLEARLRVKADAEEAARLRTLVERVLADWAEGIGGRLPDDTRHERLP